MDTPKSIAYQSKKASAECRCAVNTSTRTHMHKRMFVFIEEKEESDMSERCIWHIDYINKMHLFSEYRNACFNNHFVAMKQNKS